MQSLRLSSQHILQLSKAESSVVLDKHVVDQINDSVTVTKLIVVPAK